MKEKQKNINLIYGRSGTGKSRWIYKNIDKEIDKFKNIYVVVPEQSNLTSEKKFFEITGRDSLFNVEVLTLSRMAYRVSNEVGKKSDLLSKQGKAMLIYDLLANNKEELNFLGKTDKNIEVVEKMFTEFKKHNIGIDDLKQISLDNKYTELKLQDMTLLYEKYEEKLSESKQDENDVLTELAKQIKHSKMFDNSAIYFDDFFGFTPQEYNVFEELIQKCDEVRNCYLFG